MSGMGNQSHVGEFLSNKSLEVHEDDFKSGRVTYLSIISSSGILAGYIIFCKEKQTRTVQLKRIIINERHLGIGQKAIKLFEYFCTREYSINRIWLDVYEINSKAIYVYEKLGYIKFKENIKNSKSVLYYDKML